MKKTEFAYFAFLIVLAICCFASEGHAASVGPSGYTNDFSSQPIAADWSTYAPPGGNTTYGSAGDIDAAMATLDVSAIIQDLTVDGVNPPAATGNATWCSSGFFVQTRPTSVAGTMLMCTLVNNIGGAASSVTISYDFAKVAVLAEEIDGQRVYYSLSGQPGSWGLIAAFSSVAPGRLTSTLNITWPSGGNLYLLWVDDNAVAASPDTAMQIDNFSAIATPATPVPVQITSQPQSQTVAEFSPVSFAVGTIGNPPPTFQWFKNNNPINGATNANYTIAASSFSDNGAHFKVTAANTVSNVNYSVPSSDAVLTVNPDTNAPLASYSPAPGSTLLELNFISVVFNKAVVGVNASDLLIDGAGATSVVTNNPNDYTFYFTQPPTGTVFIAWAATHGITDSGPLANPFGGGSFVYTLDTNLANNGSPILSEFLADNSTSIRDEDFSHSDWIELANVGAVPTILDRYYLTDTPTNLTKWQFPAGTPPLQAGGYMIVWASQKNRVNPSAPLHTNFKLSKEPGGYLALVSPGTNIVSAFESYPVQQTDVSYGRDSTELDLVGYYATPTPGSRNSTNSPGILLDPVFSLNTGIYTNASLTLTISNPAGTGTIRFTTNATLPTSTSTAYTGPITFGANITVKARTFPPGGSTNLPSAIVARNFIFLDNTSKTFTSKWPTLIISTEGRAIAQDVLPGQPRTKGSLVVIPTSFGRSSVLSQPEVHELAEFEYFGQTSIGFPKQPIRIEIQDPYGNDLDKGLLGMPSDADWRLRNPYDDKTLLNDFLGFELWEKMGHYSVRRKLVEVFRDTGGGRVVYPDDYYGVMVLAETIKAGKHRVDIPSLSPYATNEPAVSGGYIFARDKASTGDLDFSSPGGLSFSPVFQPIPLKLHEPKPNALRTAQGVTTAWPGAGYTPSGSNQMTYLRNFLGAMERAMYTNTWTTQTGTNHYSYYLDVERFADQMLHVEMTKQIDGYRLSDYFSKDRGGKLGPGPVWDWNLSFGNANYLAGGETNGWYYEAAGETDHPWARRLITGSPSGTASTGDPNFVQLVADRWAMFRTNVLNATNLLAEIDQLSSLLTEAAARDLFGKYRGSIAGIYQWPNPDGGVAAAGSAGSIDGRDVDYVRPTNYYGANIETVAPAGATNSIIGQMKKWVLGRYLWIDSQFTRMPTFSAIDGLVTNGFQVTVTPPAGTTLYYTLDGTDPRASGGGVASGVSSNNGPVTLNINSNVRIVARAKGTAWKNTYSGSNAVSLYTAIPPLRIVEIMYHPLPPPPGSTNLIEDFEYIEVKNTSATPLNVSRFTLSGGVQFAFPNTVLAAGQSAVIVANTDAFQSRYGTNILILGTYTGSLNNAGDHLVITGGLQESILNFSYEDGWYPATDGLGFSLVAANESAPTGAWNTSANWRPGVLGGSPGTNNTVAPQIPAVVINEVLTHTGPAVGDAIELYNPTASTADISGWFLSDDFNTPQKYIVPPGTTIPAGGYLVLYETNSFGFNGAMSFALSADGDEVWLFSGNAANLTGYAQGFDFGAAPLGGTFGRYITSIGKAHYPAQRASTLGSANAGPLVGPVVISEINYHPADIGVDNIGYKNPFDEFIELQNVSSDPAPLYDLSYTTNSWRLRDAVDYWFPTGTVLPPGGFLLVVSFDPAADPAATASFRARNAVPNGVPIYGPWNHGLDNGSASVELARPDVPTTNGVPYILVDRVKYSDGTPWPVAADGFGLTLQRIVPSSYGDDPSNWTAVASSPGANYVAGGTVPTITSQPGDRLVATSTDLILQVSANGTGPLRYQWQRNGLNLGDGTNSILLLQNFQANQAGVYNILVFNGAGYALGTNFTITSRIGLKITGQPADRFVLAGNNATFNIGAVGYGTLRFQWRLNGNNIANATNSLLTVTNVQPSNEGTYTCAVSDDIDSTVSQPAILAIVTKPVITQNPLPQSAVPGGTVTFSASANGSLPISFWWRRASQYLTNSFNGFILTTSTNSFLTLTNLALTNAANYSVAVSNIAGGATGGSVPGLSTVVALTILTDSDGDGYPDAYETNSALHPCFNLDPASASDGMTSLKDSDGDGMTDWQEFVAGTDPCDANSYLEAILGGPNATIVQFPAVSNRTYTVQYSDRLTGQNFNTQPWKKLADVVARSTNRVEAVVDTNPRTNRLYRITSPTQP